VERESTGFPCVQNWLWKGLWTCSKKEYGIMTNGNVCMMPGNESIPSYLLFTIHWKSGAIDRILNTRLCFLYSFWSNAKFQNQSLFIDKTVFFSFKCKRFVNSLMMVCFEPKLVALILKTEEFCCINKQHLCWTVYIRLKSR